MGKTACSPLCTAVRRLQLGFATDPSTGRTPTCSEALDAPWKDLILYGWKDLKPVLFQDSSGILLSEPKQSSEDPACDMPVWRCRQLGAGSLRSEGLASVNLRGLTVGTEEGDLQFAWYQPLLDFFVLPAGALMAPSPQKI